MLGPFENPCISGGKFRDKNFPAAMNEYNNRIKVRFEVFTAVTRKNASFGMLAPSGSCKNRRFRGTCHFHHQGDKNRRGRNVSSNRQLNQAAKIFCSVLRLPVTANVVPISPILETLFMEAIRSSEMSFLQELHGVTSQKTTLLIEELVETPISIKSVPHKRPTDDYFPHEFLYTGSSNMTLALFRFRVLACTFIKP
jgi:hypothetical protein